VLGSESFNPVTVGMGIPDSTEVINVRRCISAFLFGARCAVVLFSLLANAKYF
jgi:hypothetical protein